MTLEFKSHTPTKDKVFLLTIKKAIERDITIAKSNFDSCGGGDAELYWAGREDALQILKAKIEHLEGK